MISGGLDGVVVVLRDSRTGLCVLVMGWGSVSKAHIICWNVFPKPGRYRYVKLFQMGSSYFAYDVIM